MRLSRTAALTSAALLFLSLSISSLILISPANGEQRLVNGSFEQGAFGWTAFGADIESGCPAISGAALGLKVTQEAGRLQQDVQLSPGTYQVRISARTRAGGSAAIRGQASWIDEGALQTRRFDSLPLSGTYKLHQGEFVMTIPATVTLSFTITPSAANVCLDEASLEGPFNVPTLTPTPSLTPTPTETATPTATSTPTPRATSTSTSTALPTATQTPQPGGTAAASTATSAAAPPRSLRFTNGGFEDGTDGWDNFGGEIGSVSNPRVSGSAAGRLSSSTSSTKRAYQVVAIDPAQSYEFEGSLQTDNGVSEAYLRIAWYTSADGSGSQLSTVDSTSKLGPGRTFSALTTGPVMPPATARSAQVRVMLLPGAGAATVYMDDFSFTSGPPVTVTPTPRPATATAQAAKTATSRAADGLPPEASGADDEEETQEEEIAGARATAASSSAGSSRAKATSTPRNRGSALDVDEPTDSDDGLLPSWSYLAIPAAAMALAGGLWLGRRREGG